MSIKIRTRQGEEIVLERDISNEDIKTLESGHCDGINCVKCVLATKAGERCLVYPSDVVSIRKFKKRNLKFSRVPELGLPDEDKVTVHFIDTNTGEKFKEIWERQEKIVIRSSSPESEDFVGRCFSSPIAQNEGCPFCDSTIIEGGEPYYDEEEVEQIVECLDCGLVYKECYRRNKSEE